MKPCPSSTPTIMDPNPPQCDYFSKCERYLQTITNIKSVKGIFDSRYDKCFCDDCATIRGDTRANTAGIPPQKFVVPQGYAKFGVSLPCQAKQLDVFNQWHVCYHGTNATDMCSILQCGRLLKPGDKNPDGSLRAPGPGRWTESTAPEGHNVKQYFFSPTPRYSVLYSTEENFIDGINGDCYKARIVLQVRIKPGAYVIGPSTVANHLRPEFGPIDHDFTDNELEWMTDHECVHYIYGVLIKLERQRDNPW